MAIKTSYKQTADAQLTTKGGFLRAYLIGTDGTNNATFKIYDVSSSADIADSNCLMDLTVVGATRYGGRNIPEDGLPFFNGLYVDITGTGAYYFVEYK